MTAPSRPALRYYGGKWRLAPWILSHFPPHQCYVEPFGGAGSLLLRKRPSRVEVYNDMDESVVTFFRVLRERPGELVRALELTPFSRRELEICGDRTADVDDMEKARRVYVRCWQGRGRMSPNSNAGWRFRRGSVKLTDWVGLEHLHQVARRLREVQIEQGDACEVILRFDSPSTLFYVDPPYLAETRSNRWETAYGHEYSVDDHRRLATVLHEVEGSVILSGYGSELYGALYADWHLETAEAHTESGHKTECLWISPAAMKRQRQRPLFEVEATA